MQERFLLNRNCKRKWTVYGSYIYFNDILGCYIVIASYIAKSNYSCILKYTILLTRFYVAFKILFRGWINMMEWYCPLYMSIYNIYMYILIFGIFFTSPFQVSRFLRLFCRKFLLIFIFDNELNLFY